MFEQNVMCFQNLKQTAISGCEGEFWNVNSAWKDEAEVADLCQIKKELVQ